jgi:hypothetical protein
VPVLLLVALLAATTVLVAVLGARKRRAESPATA